jgi:hypothetical protein
MHLWCATAFSTRARLAEVFEVPGWVGIDDAIAFNGTQELMQAVSTEGVHLFDSIDDRIFKVLVQFLVQTRSAWGWSGHLPIRQP